MNIKEKRHNMLMDQYGDAIAGYRTEMYHQAEGLEKTLQAMLNIKSSSKRTEGIYFQPLRGAAREMQARVVYFNQRVRIWDPDGSEAEPFFWCKKLVKQPADRAAKMPSEWVLEDAYGNTMYMRDLSTDDLLFLADRLFDKDCSIDIHWTEEVGI